MRIRTKFLGEIDIDENDIVTFEEGLLGFSEYHKYVLINIEDTYFTYMQSIDEAGLCFILIPPAVVVGNYDIEISEEAVTKLGLQSPEEAVLYSIVTIPDDMTKMTANLQAPILINARNKKALQEILNTDAYSIRHRIISEEGNSSC